MYEHVHAFIVCTSILYCLFIVLLETNFLACEECYEVRWERFVVSGVIYFVVDSIVRQ